MESPFTDLMVLTDQDLRALQTPEGVFDNFTRVMILNARQAICEAIDEIALDYLEGFCIQIENIEEIAEGHAEWRTREALRLIERGASVEYAYSQIPA